jgi:ankyrin repeat protein
LTENALSFLRAALVPRDGSHTAGDLTEANARLAALGRTDDWDIFLAATLGDSARVAACVASDATCATATGGPYAWDALTHLCFSRYLRLDASRSDGFLRAAALLIDAGANPGTGFFDTGHGPHPEFESVLYGAAGVAHHAALTRLLLERGADPNDGETPYHAPESNDLAVIRELVASGKLSADSMTTMLLRKADWHDGDGIRYLLENGADPNRPTRWGHTALQQALRRDNAMEQIVAMLDHGADPNLAIDDTTMSALRIAAHRGRADVLTECARRGIAVPLSLVDALVAACACNDEIGARRIAAQAPDALLQLQAIGGVVLAQFAGNNNVHGVRLLLDLGVPVDAPYEVGDGYFGIPALSLPIHVAAWRAAHEVVALLIERGAAINAADANGRTPLQLAVRACVNSYWSGRRTSESVRALLNAGARITNIPLPTGYDAVDELLLASGRS